MSALTGIRLNLAVIIVVVSTVLILTGSTLILVYASFEEWTSTVVSIVIGSAVALIVYVIQSRQEREIHSILAEQRIQTLGAMIGPLLKSNFYLGKILDILLRYLADVYQVDLSVAHKAGRIEYFSKEEYKNVEEYRRELMIEASFLAQQKADLHRRIVSAIDFHRLESLVSAFTKNTSGTDFSKSIKEWIRECEYYVNDIQAARDEIQMNVRERYPKSSLKRFERIAVDKVIDRSKKYVICVGSRRRYEIDSSGKLKKEQSYYTPDVDMEICKLLLRGLKQKFGVTCEIRTDREITIQDKRSLNIIVIGGPYANSIAKELNNELAIPYVFSYNGFYSRISGESYHERSREEIKYGTLQVTRSKWMRNGFTIMIGGLRREGTEAAALAFLTKPEDLRNNKDGSYLAKVIEINELKKTDEKKAGYEIVSFGFSIND